MMGKHRWKGELAKPIRIGSIPIETTEPTDHYLQAAIESEFAEKLNLLAEILPMNPKPASMFAFSRPSCKTEARC
jgi:hypothetical protein